MGSACIKMNSVNKSQFRCLERHGQWDLSSVFWWSRKPGKSAHQRADLVFTEFFDCDVNYQLSTFHSRLSGWRWQRVQHETAVQMHLATKPPFAKLDLISQQMQLHPANVIKVASSLSAQQKLGVITPCFLFVFLL